MTKFIGGMEKVKLTSGLLDLIIMVQEYDRFLRSQNLFNEKHDIDRIDVCKKTEEYYNNIDDDILAKYKLSTNKISFEKVMSYQVTNEMKSTEYGELPNKFTF